MTKTKGNRAAYKMAWDPINRVQVGQWVDNKVVSVVSSNRSTVIGVVERRIGPKRHKLPCPQILINYQKTMFGVDKGDQYRAAGMGFACKRHFRKWYKKALMGVLDFMLLNGFLAWRMSIKYTPRRVPGRPELERYEFYAACAQELLETVDETVPGESENEEDTAKKKNEETRPDLGEHIPTFTYATGVVRTRFRCMVCHLDLRMARRKVTTDDMVDEMTPELTEAGCNGKHVFSQLAQCTKGGCKFVAHSAALPEEYERSIHKFEEFRNLTCFEIIHSEICRDLFNMNSTKMGVKTSHPIYQRIRISHGLEARMTRNCRCNPRTQTPRTEAVGDSEDSDEIYEA